MRIVRVAPGVEQVALASAELFDAPPTEARAAKSWTANSTLVLEVRSRPQSVFADVAPLHAPAS